MGKEGKAPAQVSAAIRLLQPPAQALVERWEREERAGVRQRPSTSATCRRPAGVRPRPSASATCRRPTMSDVRRRL